MNARGCREPRARYSEEFRNSEVLSTGTLRLLLLFDNQIRTTGHATT